MGEYLKELKIRYVKTRKKNPFYGDVICGPEEIHTIFKNMRWNDTEQLISVHLNSRNEINCYQTLSIGDLTSCTISPREVFKGVMLSNSIGFILIHNHPSGNISPSDTDLAVLNQPKLQAKLMGITMIDFMIIADDGYWSFAKEY